MRNRQEPYITKCQTPGAWRNAIQVRFLASSVPMLEVRFPLQCLTHEPPIVTDGYLRTRKGGYSSTDGRLIAL